VSEWFANGRIIDLILALVVVEAVVLEWVHRRTGRAVGLKDMAGNLLAGMCLLIALRCALAGTGWYWIAMWLLASLCAHIADLARRSQR
jgi:hypothetical protein